MSANQPNTIEKTYKYFDLDTFEQKSETVNVEFTPPSDLNEANTRLNALGNANDVLLQAITAYLRTKALNAAEQTVVSKGGRKSVVLAVLKPFRAMPPFNSMFVLDASGKVVTETYTVARGERKGQSVTENKVDKVAQTKAILDLVKSNPAMINAIKQASLEATADGEETDDEA